MYLRLTVLLVLFSRPLFLMLAGPLIVLACIAGVAGWLWSRVSSGRPEESTTEFQPRNPLELRAAILFAGLFLVVLVATRLTVTHLGNSGIYGLAAVIGLTDVDPFILGMAQSAGTLMPASLAAASILIACVEQQCGERNLRIHLR